MSIHTTESPDQTEPAPGIWRIVARREIVTRLRDKTYVISALVMVVAVVAMIVITSIIGGKPKVYDVGVVETSAATVVSSASSVVDTLDDGSSARPRSYDDRVAVERAVSDGDVDAALLSTSGGFEVVGEDSVDETLSSALSTAVASSALATNAQEQGVDLDALQGGAQVDERLLAKDADQAGERTLVAFVFVLLFYITALTFGMTIAQSVTQEKESRVVEILAAAIPIRALLWGKIIGNSVLALGQVALLSVVGAATLALAGRRELLSMIWPALGWNVVFFVLGFVALAGVWSVAGSLAPRQEDLQSTTMPAHILLFAPYILAVTAGEGVKTVVSMLPVVSSMIMPARLAEGSVPAWQVGVALAANLVAILVLVRVGARVYERTLLRTDRKIGFGEALRISE